MMRTGLIVVGLSTLTVLELGTPSRTKTNAPDPFDQLTVDVSASPDTLEAADRIEIHHLQDEAPLQPASPVEPTLPPDVTTLASEDSSAVGLDDNDKKHVARKQKLKPRYTNYPNKPRPERTNSNKAPKIERSKAIVEVKPCRSNALDGLFQALNLSSRCQT
jgi:hypothetical protein